MKKLAKVLTRLQPALLYTLPAVLFFSYHPVIPLGGTESMNLELSLPLIWLLLFSLLSLPTLPQSIKYLRPKPWQTALAALFPLYLLLSLIWTLNLLRGLLTAGIIDCLFITTLTLPRLITSQKIKHRLAKILLITSALVAAFCWLQSVLDLVGFSRQQTLACLGCTTTSFGFPHPNGFAIEPQFMGNLLLAPTLLSFYLFLHGSASSRRRAQLLGLSLFLSTTLFFTFSRGAIYAFLVASAVIMVVALVRRQRSGLLLLPVILVSALVSLSFQGLFSALSPTSDDFWSGVTKSVHQLTLGTVDFRPQSTSPAVVENTTENGDIEPEDSTTPEPVTSTFDGYVAVSTDARLGLNAIAIKTWQRDPVTIMLGTGLGGAGTAMYQAGYIAAPKEITQNQYTEILLELGLVGTALLVALIVVIITLIKQAKLQLLPSAGTYLLALVLAYAITISFFSGLPNALHIYLLPPLGLLLAKDQSLVNQKVQRHTHHR